MFPPCLPSPCSLPVFPPRSWMCCLTFRGEMALNNFSFTSAPFTQPQIVPGFGACRGKSSAERPSEGETGVLLPCFSSSLPSSSQKEHTKNPGLRAGKFQLYKQSRNHIIFSCPGNQHLLISSAEGTDRADNPQPREKPGRDFCRGVLEGFTDWNRGGEEPETQREDSCSSQSTGWAHFLSPILWCL